MAIAAINSQQLRNKILHILIKANTKFDEIDAQIQHLKLLQSSLIITKEILKNTLKTKFELDDEKLEKELDKLKETIDIENMERDFELAQFKKTLNDLIYYKSLIKDSLQNEYALDWLQYEIKTQYTGANSCIFVLDKIEIPSNINIQELAPDVLQLFKSGSIKEIDRLKEDYMHDINQFKAHLKISDVCNTDVIDEIDNMIQYQKEKCDALNKYHNKF